MKPNKQMQNHEFIAVGSTHWDILGRSDQNMQLHDDVPGRIRRLIGGVSGPIAMKLSNLGEDVSILGYAGFDALGDALIAKLKEYNVNTSLMVRGDRPTDIYMGVEAQNGLIAAIADCKSLEDVSDEIIQTIIKNPLKNKTLIVDGNISKSALSALANTSFQAHHLVLVPASPGKIDRLAPFAKRKDAALYVNLREANLLCHTDHTKSENAAISLIENGFKTALVSNGAQTSTFANQSQIFTARPPQIEVRRFTGAGDTLSAHHIYANSKNMEPQIALEYALEKTALFISQEDLDV